MRFTAMVSVLLVIASVFTVSCGATPAGEDVNASGGDITIDTTALYNLVGVQSNKCVDVAGGSTASLAALEIATCSGATHQQFRAVSVAGSGGFFQLVNVNSGLCADVTGASTATGVAIIQFACGAGTNQQWSFTDVATGVERITSRSSGLVMDVTGQATADGTPLDQWTSNGGQNQQFKLVVVGSSSSSGSGSSSSGSSGGGAAGPYTWQNVTMLGGGFVPGVVFSPVQQNLYYARTDIGGFYRWVPATSSWLPLTDGLPYNEMGGESIAPDPVNPNVVYAAGGMNLTSGNGVILRSSNQGNTWTVNPIAVPMGGNTDGRSMGERLAVDPHDTSKLYFASRTLGLWTSTNAASTWSRVQSFPVTGTNDLGLSFVLFDGPAGTVSGASSTVYVGVASTAAGSNLYRTTNGGATWALVPGGPSGLMPHHAALSSTGVMYLAYNNGPGPNSITQGAVWKLDTVSGAWTNISPPSGGGGFGGVTVDAENPATVIVSTIDWWNPDEIYRTTNGGSSWTAIGRAAQHNQNGAQYLCFGPAGCTDPSSAGWMGDIKIDPFNSAHVIFVTGQGVWQSNNANGATVSQIAWTFTDKALEETAVIAMTGSVKGALLSAVGDIGGFRHPDVTQPPPLGMYTNPVFGNTTGIDFAELNDSIVARVGSAGGTQFGAFSVDNGQTWTPFTSQPAGSTGSGAVAVSANGGTFVWAPANTTTAFSQNHGATWTASTGLPNNLLVASDRVNPNKFYAVDGGTVYVSTNGGASFAPGATGLSGDGQARPVFGIEGDLWIPAGSHLYHSTSSGASVTAVAGVQAATAVGFGQAPAGKTYPAVFLIGTVNNVSGFFRSDNEGVAWTQINDAQHQFGAAGTISGDEGIFGRVYVGTNGRGILYGNP